MLNSIAGGNDFVAAYADERHQRRRPVASSTCSRTARSASIEDIAGKTIAVNTLGAHLDYTVREALHQRGLPKDAANLVVVPGPQLEQVLRSEQVDIAAFGYWQTTFEGAARKNGGIRAVFDDTDVLGEIAGGFVVLRRDLVEAHPERGPHLRRAVRPRARLCPREPRGDQGDPRQGAGRSAARTPRSPSTSAATACARAACRCGATSSSGSTSSSARASSPTGKLVAADLLLVTGDDER